jgi:hypothetical protein
MDLTRRRVVLLLAAVDGFSLAADAQDQPSQTKLSPDPKATAGALRNVLGGLVRYEVVRRGARLAPPAEKEVDSIAGAGTDQLLKRNEIANAFAVSIAIDGARRLGVEIVNEAVRTKENLQQIGAKVVQAAREKVCPLFPFC